MEQQENEEEINDDYRPTTNGTDTTAPPENPNPENDDTISSNGTAAPTNAPSTSAPPNWNQSKFQQSRAIRRIVAIYHNEINLKVAGLLQEVFASFIQSKICENHRNSKSKANN